MNAKANTQTDKATTGFSFDIEFGVEPPARTGGGGNQKYDWTQFPAPKDPNDPKTWPSSVVDVATPKSLYKSIKGYKDKLLEEGVKEEDLPTFTVSGIKDPDTGKVIKCRVYRTK